MSKKQWAFWTIVSALLGISLGMIFASIIFGHSTLVK